ncbi:MAG: discoidin domain-containing protein [Planctomycetes bacterium]|nr:discoidin domain-containing protein [Planctomycetota bacterium]
MSNKLIYPISFILVLALAGFAQAEILLNPDFEAGLDSWKTWGSGSGSGAGGYFWSSDFHANVMVDGTAQSGNTYVDIGFTPPDVPWWGYCYAFQEHPVTEGKTYQMSAWLRDADADGAPSLIAGGGTIVWEFRVTAPVGGPDTGDRGDLLDIDGDGTGGNSDKIHYVFDLTEEWTYFSTTEVAPPGAKGLTVIFGTPTSFVNVDIDNASFIELGAKALYPDPPDGATDVYRLPVLSWMPGKFAAPTNGHKVYFSENFNNVNDGIGGVTQDANSYAPGQRLDFGTTYYWRVDEVNNVNPDSPWIGDVWSFTTEPFAYPVENITATASSSLLVDTGPENTVNGSGLDADDLHSIEATDMWISDSEPNGAWIEFEFDKIYKLHEMSVWNSNQMTESFVGYGYKDVIIEYSVDGNDYTTLGATHEFSRAPGTLGYAHNTTIDFGGAAAKYVRLTTNNNWGGILPQYSLSEVRFLYIPLRAKEPQPESGATDVDVDLVLSWRAGREAAEHNVYISTDEQAVIDSNVPVSIVTEAQDGPISLDLGETYYWKVNEVNMAETPTMLQGDIWNFTTSDSLVVEDFESYNDLNPDDPNSNRIFNTWIDGYSNPAINGSVVGYSDPPFTEQSTVYDGKQSMPFSYDNSTASYSEATVNIANLAIGGNWTLHGIESLSLWFYGDPNNALEQMYVKLNGVKVLYDGDAGNITKSLWHPWDINLADFAGVDLSSVIELSIGFERIGLFGGSGTVLFDGIRLYGSAPAQMEPIAVENFSFELPGTEKQSMDTVPGWNTDGSPADSGVETDWTPTDGDWTAYLMSGDPSVWQLTDHTIMAGDVFEVKVDARITWAATTLQMTIYYDDNGTRVPAVTSDVTLSDDMQEYILSFSAGDVPESAGHQIGIEFTNASSGSTWIGLDNVRLYVASN